MVHSKFVSYWQNDSTISQLSLKIEMTVFLHFYNFQDLCSIKSMETTAVGAAKVGTKLDPGERQDKGAQDASSIPGNGVAGNKLDSSTFLVRQNENFRYF